MYKALIVDDFEVDRQKLKKAINTYFSTEIEIVGECENGRQALDVIEYNMPDIIISDIEMPYMNGLEMAKNIKTIYNTDVKIVFCTLYDEFRYAKEAICSNSYGYILKPVLEEELVDCINRIIGDISREAQFKNEYKNLRDTLESFKPVLTDNFLKEILYGINTCEANILEKADYFNVKLIKGCFRVLYIEIDDYEIITAEQKIEQKQMFSIKIFDRIKTVIDNSLAFPITRIDEMHFAVIISGSGIGNVKEDSIDCARKVKEFSRGMDISLSMSLSDCSTKLDDIKNLFEQCKFLMRYKFSIGKGEILSSDDIPSTTDFNDIDINLLQKDIRYILNTGGREDIVQYIDNKVQEMSGKTDSNTLKNFCFSLVICVRVVLNENNVNFGEVFNNETLVWEKLLKFETILDAVNWIKNILLFANEHIGSKASNKNNTIVDEIKKYIDCNIGKNFGLEDLASEMHYSPNYLNYVFKQVSGVTINDYITSCKIEKAKEFLLDIRNKVQDISANLGYSHSAYFCSVFKKITGMTPKEYRERVIQ